MFPRVMQHYRRTRDHASHDTTSLPYGAVQSSQTPVLDEVAPTHGRGLTQVEAVTDQDPNEYGAPQDLQRLIDAQLAQYCTAFDPYPLTNEPPSDALRSGALEPVEGEQQSSGSLFSQSRGSSTAPSYSPVTPVEETYAGSPDSFEAETTFRNLLGLNGTSVEDERSFKARAADDTTLATAASQSTALMFANAANDGSSQLLFNNPKPLQAPFLNPGNLSQLPSASDGLWNGMPAYNELANSKFSPTSASNTSYVYYQEQNASRNVLPMHCIMQSIDPELLKTVPPTYPSLSSDFGLNVVETVLPTPLSTGSDVWRIESLSRKRKRVDEAMSGEASAVSAENPSEKGKAGKNAKSKLVLADGRPLSALPLNKITEALGLKHVNPPDTTFKCVVPGCNEVMLESRLLSHFNTHAAKEGPNLCPVCTRAFNTAAAFGRHLRDVHLRAQELKCSVCRGKVNREADDQIRRHLTARKHEDVWKLLGLIRVKDDGVSVARAKDDAARAHGSEEDDRGEGSSKGVKRQRYS